MGTKRTTLVAQGRRPTRAAQRKRSEEEYIMPRTPAKKAKKAAASHPPYATMVQEAIKDLKDRTGSSTVAIAKWVESKYTLPDTFKKKVVKKKPATATKKKPAAKVTKKKVVKKKPKKVVKKPKKAAPKKKTTAPKKKIVKKKK